MKEQIEALAARARELTAGAGVVVRGDGLTVGDAADPAAAWVTVRRAGPSGGLAFVARHVAKDGGVSMGRYPEMTPAPEDYEKVLEKCLRLAGLVREEKS